ncbi:metal-dependent hydrolase [Bacillota bacterium LX-D]|nr:metal-dependent hydrolase [Bacillota bacterium LX-D]
MDPITHALVGLGIGGFSGIPFSLTNPVYLGASLGAMAPDLDILYQLKGDITYLKHHRGFSHSLPGIFLLSVGISIFIYLINPSLHFSAILLWTFLGTLSHGVLDILNSYGSKIFWPFSNKMWTVNLINAVDPIVLIILVTMTFFQKAGYSSVFGLAAFGGYLLIRYIVATRVNKLLQRKYPEVEKITVMPSLIKFWCWDCLVETNQQIIFTEFNSFTSKLVVKRELPKEQTTNLLIKKALDSKIGKMFREFTPHLYVLSKEGSKGYLVKFFDLRFYLKHDFLHSATVLFNQRQEMLEQVFHPYNKKRNIKITG